MRFALVVIGTLLLIGAPLQTWLMLGGDMTEYLTFDTLPGQAIYVISKVFALYAVELAWLQCMLGLLRGDLLHKAGMQAKDWRRLHSAAGYWVLAAVLAHVVLFVVATSMRNRSPAIDLLLPWGKGVYRTWVAFGAAALWLLVIAVVVRLMGGPSVVRWKNGLHRLALLAIILVGVHSLTVGTESRSGSMLIVYGVMGIGLALAIFRRLLRSRGPRLVQA
ncbi:MAG TPA: hypothetical protein VFP68_15950 [Burkholderiaceae bacterium]|nr:hypothetical protein [Burkholderiaceae bacterium]